jgi:hypothetical protein
MRFIFLLIVVLIAPQIYGQDLRLVVNIGHQSTITYFEESFDGTMIFTATENDIIKRDIQSGRILFKHIANGKFDAVSLSDDKKELVAFEGQKNRNLIHIWDASDDQLFKTFVVDSLLPKYADGEVIAIKYYKAFHSIGWITRQHVYFLDVHSNVLNVDPGLKVAGRYIYDAVFSKKSLFFHCKDNYINQDSERIYAIDINNIPVNSIAPICSTDSVVNMYPIHESNTLVILKWHELDLFDLQTGLTKKILVNNPNFSILYNCSVYKNPLTAHLEIASNGKLLDIDVVGLKSNVISFDYSSFERSCFSAFNPDALYTAENEKLYLMSIQKKRFLKAYDNVRLDDPSNIIITRDNQILCESRYINTTCNIFNLNDLTFRQIKSVNQNDAYGVYLQEENKFVKILVDYSTYQYLKSQETYWLTTLNLNNDSTESLNLNKIISHDSLYYPRLGLSPDHQLYLVFSKSQIYCINRYSKKLVSQFANPSKISGYNNSLNRPLLFLKDNQQAVFADLNIVVYDLVKKNVTKIIKNDLDEYTPYFNIVLNHDSTKVIYEKDYSLYSYHLQFGSTDTLGYFRWISEFVPITVKGANYWVIGYKNGIIEVRDELLKNVITSYKAHESSVHQILFDARRDRLITVGSDGLMCFFDTQGFQPELKGYFLNTGKYSNTNVFLFNDSNQYYLSSNLINAVHIVSGNKAFDYVSLDPLLNRPDVIAERLKADRNIVVQLKAAYELRKQRVQAGSLNELNLLPKCQIIGKEKIPFTIDSNHIKIDVRYQWIKYSIKRIVVKDNNVLTNTVNVFQQANKGNEVAIDIRLLKGNNHIQIYAEDSAGNRSLYESVDIECEPKEYFRGRLVFIGIGISTYADSSHILSFAAKDVQDVADSFKQASFSKDIIITLIDSVATTANLRKLISVLKNTNPEDKVIIYFSGHGVRSNKGFMFCLFETDFNHLSETAFSFEELSRLFDNVPARKRLVFIDACQSGDIITGRELKSLVSRNAGIDSLQKRNETEFDINKTNSELLEFYNSYFSNFSTESGIQVIAASYGNNSAVERLNLNNGIFTFCFLKGLFSKEAYDGDEYSPKGRWYPNLVELRNYLYRKVGSISHGKQLPSTVFIDPNNSWNFHDILSDN